MTCRCSASSLMKSWENISYFFSNLLEHFSYSFKVRIFLIVFQPLFSLSSPLKRVESITIWHKSQLCFASTLPWMWNDQLIISFVPNSYVCHKRGTRREKIHFLWISICSISIFVWLLPVKMHCSIALFDTLVHYILWYVIVISEENNTT